jgi:hypothetical protein
MSWLTDFLHPGRPYENAQNQMQQYFNAGQGMLQPYQQHGLDSYSGLSDAMNALLNPSKLNDQWMKDYHESDAAKFAEERAKNRGLDAASSLGLMGSTPALSAIQRGTAEIGAQDQQNYLQNMMQKYLAGTGIGQNLYNTGAGTAGQMAQNMMNMGQNASQMQFGRDSAGGNLFGGLLGSGLGLLGGFLGNRFGGSGMGNQNYPHY